MYLKKYFFPIILVVIAGIITVGYFVFLKPKGTAVKDNPDSSFIGLGEYTNLSGKGLTEFPMGILKQTSMEELDLSDNQLTGAFPAEIKNLANLKVLRASNNRLTGIPAEIGQITQLEILDFSFNQITGLPNEIANLKNLKVLNLRGNIPSQQDMDYILRALPDLKIIL
ncbi:MAG: Leucine-rich repeat-containing protein 40 [Parcubacteria group bacterium GW2011_GWB1_46_8]|nr:MAG: Leucine-rich repeat-containing protein 40 [Parcubacteria group bacterium GW2011_GWF1_45_5]KKU10443.1 MAG: Leucine-rich repeat-containing protein 40 [Parcubacteria group bacterium GW2011_GWA1_45_7]KKU43193.1 MAG: Leucine-rich repeat-containing protein 40 [Parcubacteria group bacterium GW2011_GWA2_46_7]KKU46480.1 MAG: Leucine-rich repeat-containing protein 40 [Parcubacteria group bacterium GW2011_GWB1_46_8]KKU47037.1 MAG: Leucine-rich repeat-containing protein 40 [Parcubacteria group bact